MKRSEMVALLDSQFIWPEGMAKTVLDILEDAGMLPPPHDAFKNRENTFNDMMMVNKWEDEDASSI